MKFMSYLQRENGAGLLNPWVRGGLGCVVALGLFAAIIFGISSYFDGLS